MSMRARHEGATTSTASRPAAASVLATGPGNQAVATRVAAVREAGGPDPIRRLFDRISAGDEAFTAGALRNYLDEHLELADGEWFRGAKLDGASAALMEQLDTGADGAVARSEFGAFRDTVLEAIAPGLATNATDEEAAEAAGATFDRLEGGKGDGLLSLEEIQASTKALLPADTDHADLVAQLGARVAIDAVDTDQPSLPVSERRLSRTEWVAAAVELQRARRPSTATS